MRRTRLAVAAALLAAGTPLLVAGPAQAASQVVDDATFTWKISENVWSGLTLSQVHVTTGDVSKTAEGFRFTSGEGTVDDETGEVDLGFEGSVTVGNTTFGGYRIVFADPEVTVDADGDGAISAVVSYCTAACDAPETVFSSAGRVVVSDFTTAGPVSEGTVLTWSETPIAEPVPGENPEGRVQFPQTFIDAISPAVPSLVGHFRQSGAGSDANKPPAPFTLSAELPSPSTPAEPIRPEGDLTDPSFAWSVSEYAWTIPSLSGWSSAAAPAVKGDAAYEFSEGSGTYDPDTGAVSVAFDGAIYLGNDYGTQGYRIGLTSPTIVIDAGGEGRVLADVTSCVFGQGGAPLDACDGFESLTGPQVEVVTLSVAEDDVTAGEDAVTWAVTPDWIPQDADPTKGQFSQEFLDALPASVRPFFMDTSSVNPAKRPAAFELTLGLAEPTTPTTPTTEPTTPTTEPTTPTTGVPVEPGTIVGGELEWGIKDSFRTYLVGPIAHGSVTAEAPATQAPGNGDFSFPLTGEGTFASATELDADFAGGVHLYGHEGQLDVTFTDPEVTIDGTTGELRADIEANEHGTDVTHDEADVVVATLDLSGITPTRVGDTVTYAGIPATLTEAGEIGFSGYYTAGDALDPVTLVLTVKGADLGGIGDPDPNADKVTCTPTAPVAAGSSIQVCGSGFLPGEQVRVFLHSEPVQIGIVTADAEGAVAASVTIPVDAAAGEHRIELRGVSSNRSIFSDAFTVTAAQQPGAGVLPRTGDDSTTLLRFALGLLAIGALAGGVAKRRRLVEVDAEA